ncbi:MAG: hypothetical protein CHACPFDD_02461 [Phycisphaerae bacterium]|nr:hypothetical protein [Phycisphaerae bacterium]
MLTLLVQAAFVIPFSPSMQDAATRPASSAGVDATPITARVIELQGDVQHAPMLTRAWTACKLGDAYPEQTKLRTGVRSSIKLQIGDEEPYTVIVLESVGLTVLSEAYKNPTTKRVRVGVGYGTVRAGVAEGGLQSDFTIDSPVATLSKRGTWNFGLSYDRGSERFEIFLLDYGLVDALNKVSGQRARLLPGQAVTQAMRRWLDEAQVRRNVAVTDLLGQTDISVAFNRLDQDGLGVVNLGGGRANIVNLTHARSRAAFSDAIDRATRRRSERPADRAIVPESFLRPEGFFGVGRGNELVPMLIGAGSALVREGGALPGTYYFRREVLERWQRSAAR